MKKTPKEILNEMIVRFPELIVIKEDVEKAYQQMIKTYENNGKILICGNGGSASDADHIVGELMKGFLLKRPLSKELKKKLGETKEGKLLSENLQMPLCAINLTAHSSLLTALCNDTDHRAIFAQQVLGYGGFGDILIGISTSGKSSNVICAGVTAKAMGMITIGLTGENPGDMLNWFDIIIKIPSKITPHIQDMHRPVYHALCEMIEAYFFLEG